MLKRIKWTNVLFIILSFSIIISNLNLRTIANTPEIEEKVEEIKNEPVVSEQYAHVYSEGMIHIYNLEQLKSIGTNQKLKDQDHERESFGLGDNVVVDGQEIVYSLDATYYLENDIPFEGESWNLPENFTGHFVSNEEVGNNIVYDEENDTVYIYHSYQLDMLQSDQPELNPLLTLDYDVNQFGQGQLIYKTNSEDFVAYTSDHQYVLSKSFTEKRPATEAIQIQTQAQEETVANTVGIWGNADLAGRDYIGQCYKEINGIKYILIGNRQQLEAIGKKIGVLNKEEYIQVTPTLILHSITGILNKKHTYTPLYPGDADFDPNITLQLGDSTNIKDISFKHFSSSNKDHLMNIDLETGLFDAVTGLLGGLLGDLFGEDNEVVGYNSLTGEYISEHDLKNEYRGLKYTENAHYIIFRDINLKNVNWTPLMFSGEMVGAIAQDVGGLWPNDTLVSSRQPIISDVTVNQEGALNTKVQSGIGFFGSIMSTSTKKVGEVDGTVLVKNIKLQNVSVQNHSSRIKDNTGLISIITGALGGILGTLLGDLGAVLNNILNPDMHKDPTVFATGAFVGRVSGDVKIVDCEVENITQLLNVRDYLGGFAGHVEGVTEYFLLDKVVTILEAILNIIPFIDLGTLIEILLDGNVIQLGQLIPTSYKGPQIEDCHVIQHSSLTLGGAELNYVGGFAGKVVGSTIKDSSVDVSDLTLSGKSMMGGFTGFTSNEDLKGLLEDLGVDILPNIRLNAYLLNCAVNGSTLNITASEKYAGGMSGATANSFIVDSSINANTSVHSQAYAGGITGIATLGESIALGDFEKGKQNIVELISKVLNLVVSGEAKNTLLSLTGISPSVLAGNTIQGELSVVADKDYAGGIVGQGDGVLIISSSDLVSESFIWSKVHPTLNYTVKNRANVLSNVKSIVANNYAGGCIGDARTASTTALLNQTLGVANFLKFKIADVRITNASSGSRIEANENYAGGFTGKALGGEVRDCHVSELAHVKGKNYVGGFVGYGGSGGLAEVNGLNILGLIKISNLLQLADGFVLDIQASTVSGIPDGFSVLASGKHEVESDKEKYYAGGFIGKSTSVHIRDASVKKLKEVLADVLHGYAGGFCGVSETGGLADAAGESSDVLNLIGIQNLLNAVNYLVSEFTNTTVRFVPSSHIQVKASYAGGFIGEMQSGSVDNSSLSEAIAVYDVNVVQGEYYSGGFAGKIYSGGLASSNGLSVLNGALNINLDNLTSILNVYIPVLKYAGVQSDGLTVETLSIYENDLNSGVAGGYVGYASGAKISHCDVNKLKHTQVHVPLDIHGEDGSSYFDERSSYAVSGLTHVGGYVGKLDIGNSASLGEGLDVLGLVQLNSITEALDVVASKIEYSDVYGDVGGFSVKANALLNGKDKIGHAGGYAGSIFGSQLQNCDVYQFNTIVGQESAGGYVGTLQPGNVASVIGKTDILGGVLTTSTNLVSLLQSFIPMVYNSETTSIVCGGIVRADGMSDETRARGLAGGYVGYNLGGRIEGQSDRIWNKEKPTSLKENAVYRLRSVYGYEFAGGFSGRSESANVADTGNISVLFGLIKLSNPLEALSAVYPTESHTSIYGPLRGIDVDTWNKWVNGVGVNGSYGQQLQQLGPVQDQQQLNDLINKYAYGYEVVAGRKEAGYLPTQGGVAGGYVGRMDGGAISSAHAYDLKMSKAIRSSGGFVGEMMSAGVVSVGGIDFAGIHIDGSLPILQTFVPVIKQSSTSGYRSGASILATGHDLLNLQGMAGGFAGTIVGGQIEGTPSQFVSIERLKKVQGSQAVGGFVGNVVSGSATNLDVSSQSGLLDGLLGSLLGNTRDLAKVLSATVSTIKYAKVEAYDPWGIVIDGSYIKENEVNTQYADTVGGFAGNISGAVLGDRNAQDDSLIVSHLRSVIGGQHVGGFFGLGDVGAVAQVGDNQANHILGLIKLGELDVLDTFRTYIYHGAVYGSKDNGLVVEAHTEKKSGTLNSERYTGNAGGFGGSLLNGSVKNSSVHSLMNVDGLNYVGGFIGHLGKSGVVDLDKVDALQGLLNATAGVLDNFGSHVDSCTVHGHPKGYIVSSEGGQQPLAGGFSGYADLGKIDDCHTYDMKKIESKEIAGGFVGKSDFSYLVDIVGGSDYLLDPVLMIVNTLLDYLYVDELENLKPIKINLGILLDLEILSEGNVLSVELLGLKISVGLVKNNGDGTSDFAQIHIGDSYIELPCSDITGNHFQEKDKENIKIGLIKSNRTTISHSSASGIEMGYDVFAGGSSQEMNGLGNMGMSGGFIGYNHEGLLFNNEMYYADTIRGSGGSVGPFVGVSDLETSYSFNTFRNIEGQMNHYRIYRQKDDFTSIHAPNGFVSNAIQENTRWNEFLVQHIIQIEKYDQLQNAYLTNDKTTKEANVYMTSSKAVLMNDQKVYENEQTTTPPPVDMQDPCDEKIVLTIQKIWKDFYNMMGLRPDHITVHLTRSYVVNGVVVEDSDFKQTLTIQQTDQKHTWQAMVEGLPAYKVLEDGQHAYYTYHLSEDEVLGYETNIENREEDFTILITNSHTPLLPDTGGRGTFVFTLVGSLGILFILNSYRRRNRNEKVI